MSKRDRRGRAPKRTSSLPGDLDETRLVERIIRVDQAGEFGALPVRAKVLHVNEQKGCLCWNKGQITGQCHWAPP